MDAVQIHKTKIQLSTGIAYLFLFVFVYTAFEKSVDFQTFVQSMERYAYFKSCAKPIAAVVIGSEILIAALLLFERTRLIGLCASLLLMIAFTGALYYITYVLHSSYCNCGGFINTLSASQHLWFNGLLIALAIAGIYLHRFRSQLSIN
ncbi:MauE/DoxX family redox-associated membrane protein [Sphingobacterium tabacisoli]|uniref:MauE/DoxX family redox-associated membrane protein n=1 Tax=Sphingobacterium tabacisoli TaxID=2044855 RepID=A0ABW5L513_9SPHI|nr:MauE/DoxX family redox-associated membrane protein [Sphingobacterium tabacisoli]